jgi:hypothetical protein
MLGYAGSHKNFPFFSGYDTRFIFVYLYFLVVEMTAELAKQLDVRLLMLTHFSQRYRPLNSDLREGEVSVQVLLSEAQEVFSDTDKVKVMCTEDLMTFSLTRQNDVPS